MSSKKLRRNIFIQRIQYTIVSFLLLIAKYVPVKFIYWISAVLSRVGFSLIKKRRRTAIDNIQSVYGLDDRQAYDFAKKVYLELSQTIAEMLLMVVGRFDIDQAIINLDEAKEKLNNITQNAPKGIIVITAHYSNWELAAHFLAKHGLAMLAIGRKGSNRFIDRKITIPFRNLYGNRAVYKDKAMISMAKTLKKGEFVGMLIDQKTGGTHSAPVPFFGKDALTTLSTASLKLKFDPLVVPISIVREKKGQYRVYIDEPVEYVADEITDEREKLVAMSRQYNECIENIISRAPHQWFWMHNRWKV